MANDKNERLFLKVCRECGHPADVFMATATEVIKDVATRVHQSYQVRCTNILCAANDPLSRPKYRSAQEAATYWNA